MLDRTHSSHVSTSHYQFVFRLTSKLMLIHEVLAAWHFICANRSLLLQAMTAHGRSLIWTQARTSWLVRATKTGFRVSISIQQAATWLLVEAIALLNFGTSSVQESLILSKTSRQAPYGSANSTTQVTSYWLVHQTVQSNCLICTQPNWDSNTGVTLTV